MPQIQFQSIQVFQNFLGSMPLESLVRACITNFIQVSPSPPPKLTILYGTRVVYMGGAGVIRCYPNCH